ncbi:hypothetical protein LguiB_005194 [Lonicera macranthoides]
MEEVRLSIGFCGEKIQSIKAFVLEDLGKAYFGKMDLFASLFLLHYFSSFKGLNSNLEF